MIACHGCRAPCQIYQANAGGYVDDRLRRPASAFRFPSKLGKRKMLAFAHIPTGTTTTTGVADDDSKGGIDSNTVALRHIRDLVVLPSPPNRQVTSLSVRNRDFSNSRRHRGRNIQMTPLCKVEVALPLVLGSREMRHGGGVDEQAGVQPTGGSAWRAVRPAAHRGCESANRHLPASCRQVAVRPAPGRRIQPGFDERHRL